MEKKKVIPFWKHPKLWLVAFTIIPIFVFAVGDMEYWEVIQRDFGLNNSWNAFTINFQTAHSGSTYNYIFPNNPFILYVITVICLNVGYYFILKGKES